MTWISDWPAQAACRGADPDLLFVQGAAQNRVKSMCAGCVVRTECLADALDNEIEFGVWGGMTERERRALLRKRPDVVSWKRLLDIARTSHAAGVQLSHAGGSQLDHAGGSQLDMVPAQSSAPASSQLAEPATTVLDLRGEQIANDPQPRKVVNIF